MLRFTIKITRGLVYFFIVPALYSCNEQTPPQGSLELNVLNNDTDIVNLSERSLSAFIVSIRRKGDETFILKEDRISLLNDENHTLSHPILLEVGEYELVDFVVIDSADNVIYAAPKTGSIFQNFVAEPLPISFTIEDNSVSNLSIEVIDTQSKELNDLGYSTLNFELVETTEILISVFVINGDSTALTLTSADVAVYSNEDFLYSKTLSSEINRLPLPKNATQIKLDFSVSGVHKIFTFSSSDLENYWETPLKVIFSQPSSIKPYAAYPLNGSMDDIEVNSLNGEIFGATDTLNRFGEPASALYFDGNDYAQFPEDFDFPERTISLWFNVDLWNPPTKTFNRVNTIYDSNHGSIENGITSLFIRDDGERVFLQFNLGGEQENVFEKEIQYDEWYMATMTTNANETKYYVNGELLQTVPKLAIHSLDGRKVAGLGCTRVYDRFFIGAIDDVKIYDQYLPGNMIKQLFLSEAP